MKLDLLNLENQKTGDIELNSLVFDQVVRDDIMHRVVMWQMAKRRAGTHSVKEVGDVSGSTKKIYKQKGTGRARHGSSRAAQFRGGGIIFGPCTRSHEFSLNKKVRKLGIISALSLRKQENSIIVLDALSCEGKTSDMLRKLKALGVSAALMMDVVVKQNVLQSVKNIPHINVLPVAALNVLDVLRYEKLILTVDAIKKIEERLL